MENLRKKVKARIIFSFKLLWFFEFYTHKTFAFEYKDNYEFLKYWIKNFSCFNEGLQYFSKNITKIKD